VPFRRRVRFWQATTAGALALAASLAAFVVLHHPEPARVAVLSPLAGGAPVLMATAERGGPLVVRPTAPITVPSDKDLELWALPQGETRPRSLGVLPPSGRQLTAQLEPNTQLVVSLEPKGGLPTGQPTGPVLYGGWLTMVELPRG
jgi:anti-sigma-K factor RskA